MDTSILNVSFKGALRSLSDLFMPRVCITCSAVLSPEEQVVCSDCLGDIPHTYYWLRTRNPMADSFNARIGNQGEYRGYSYAAALFFYRTGSKYSSITKALKYGRNLEAGRFFGTLLGKALSGAEHFRDIDLVVPVPLHWTRRFKRGYNQAYVIAREVAAILKVPVSDKLLRRRNRTGTQTHLNREEKAANVQSAFAIGKLPGSPVHHILLIDDVCTTGATLAECHKVLSAALGPEVRISAATLGCVE